MSEKLNGLELTRKLVSFNTINPPGNERPCVEYIADLMKKKGFETTFHEYETGRSNLIARLPPTTTAACKPIVLSGHIDTVPLGQASWSVSPFDGEVHDGKLYGRGTSDMKSGVAACVLAAIKLADLQVRKAEVAVIISAGEETGCKGVLELVKHPKLLGECGALIVSEPTDNRPMVGHKGSLWLNLHFKGVTAHGSMPDLGDNAIYKACKAIEILKNFNFGVEPHAILGGPTLNVGNMKAGMNVNSVPDFAVVGVDIRTTVGQTNAQVRGAIAAALDKEVEIEILTDMEHVYTDPEDPWMSSSIAISEKILSGAVKIETATYFTDASVLKPAFGNPPTLIMGPGVLAMAHQTDEYCEVDKIDTCSEIFQAIGENYVL
ncbi:MAG: M20 family metallopeptidase [Candidatus Omnitrophica bacterium]|nr:M20 family metallopeptidase [Candidatus Omnitrophota bacterium]